MYLFRSVRALNCMKNANLLLQKHTRTNAAKNLSLSSSFNKIQTENKNSNANVAWDRIYHFPHIIMARFLNRFKLYQTFFNVSGIPIVIYMYTNGLVEWSSVELITGCAIFASITLYVITSYFRRLIGIICISDDKNFVKISHLTFWGRRNDIVVSIDDIMPLTDGNCKPNDIYVKLQRYSTNDVLYFTLKFGKIIDKPKFEQVFGSLKVLGLK